MIVEIVFCIYGEKTRLVTPIDLLVGISKSTVMAWGDATTTRTTLTLSKQPKITEDP